MRSVTGSPSRSTTRTSRGRDPRHLVPGRQGAGGIRIAPSTPLEEGLRLTWTGSVPPGTSDRSEASAREHPTSRLPAPRRQAGRVRRAPGARGSACGHRCRRRPRRRPLAMPPTSSGRRRISAPRWMTWSTALGRRCGSAWTPTTTGRSPLRPRPLPARLPGHLGTARARPGRALPGRAQGSSQPDAPLLDRRLRELNPRRSWAGERHPFVAWLNAVGRRGRSHPGPAIAAMSRLLGSRQTEPSSCSWRDERLIDRLYTGNSARCTRRPCHRAARRPYRRALHPTADASVRPSAGHRPGGGDPHCTQGRRASTPRVLLVATDLDGVAAGAWRATSPTPSPGASNRPTSWSCTPTVRAAGLYPRVGSPTGSAGRLRRPGPGLEADEQQLALVLLLRSFQADAIVNLNSATLYFAMQTLGKALVASERALVLLLQRADAARDVDRLEPALLLPYYQRSRASSPTAGSWPRARGDPSGRFWPCRAAAGAARAGQPDAAAAYPTHPARGRATQVFWAGRWVRQKRFELLHDIAD